MSHFIIRETHLMRLGLTTSFATREEAEQAKTALDSINGFEQSIYTIETLEAYAESAERHWQRANFASANYETLKQQVTDFLSEGIDGSLDPDSFIEDHEDLINAVDFDSSVERVITLTVEVTAKVKRGYEVTADDFEIDVTTYNDEQVAYIWSEVTDCQE